MDSLLGISDNNNNNKNSQTQKHIENAEKILKKDKKVLVIKKVIPNKSHTRLNNCTDNTFRTQPLKKIPAIAVDDFVSNKKVIRIKFITEVGQELKKNHNYKINIDKLCLVDEKVWRDVVNQVSTKIRIILPEKRICL